MCVQVPSSARSNTLVKGSLKLVRKCQCRLLYKGRYVVLLGACLGSERKLFDDLSWQTEEGVMSISESGVITRMLYSLPRRGGVNIHCVILSRH